MFVNSGAKKTFIKLRQIFIKALILNHLDLKYYIYIKKDIFGYANIRILN